MPTPEQTAREKIDQQLAAGWVAQDMKKLDLGTGPAFTTCTPICISPCATNPLRRPGRLHPPANRHERQESERFKAFTYEELIQCDKFSLDIFWLKDESLEDSDALPAPDELSTEIVENLQAALAQFAAIVKALGGEEG